MVKIKTWKQNNRSYKFIRQQSNKQNSKTKQGDIDTWYVNHKGVSFALYRPLCGEEDAKTSC